MRNMGISLDTVYRVKVRPNAVEQIFFQKDEAERFVVKRYNALYKQYKIHYWSDSEKYAIFDGKNNCLLWSKDIQEILIALQALHNLEGNVPNE